MAEINAKRYRVGGSGFTVFMWDNQPIGSARQIVHQSPQPVGPGPVPIHPMDAARPLEIITPRAVGMGTLVLEFYEIYGEKVWGRLKTFAQSTSGSPIRDLADIFRIVSDTPRPIDLVKVVRPPKGSSVSPYIEQYHNCVITNVADGETIEVGTMEILKQITVAYTQVTSSSSSSINYPDPNDVTYNN
jgi:hypothetical protein